MITKIKVLTLLGCPFCEKLLLKLNDNGINYINLSCAKVENYCDEIEKIASCEMYPMVVIETIHNNVVILCLADEYKKIGTYKIENQKNIVYYLHSIDNIVNSIKKM
jgi:glutaredoxin